MRKAGSSLIWQGLRFGMLLQLSIGPVFVLVLQTAVGGGFLAAEGAVLGTVLIDAVYIAAAIFGLGTFINRSKRVRRALQFVGAGVLILFGLITVLGGFGISVLPKLGLSNAQAGSAFLKGLLLTLSSPLTIVFWAGVFAAKMGEEQLEQSQALLFGTGAILSTLLFLTLVATLGGTLGAFVSGTLMNTLNVLVGLLLIGFGIRTAVKKPADAGEKEQDSVTGM